MHIPYVSTVYRLMNFFIRSKFLKFKEAFESNGFKVNLGKTKVMVSGNITKEGMSKSNVDPCGVCSLRVKANSILCVQCGIMVDVLESNA